MDARLNYYGNPVGEKFQKYLNSAGRAIDLDPAGRDRGPLQDPGEPDQRLLGLHRHAHEGRRARGGDLGSP